MIENRLLSAFVKVAEELHFGRAAAKLNIAQPALSRQIMLLEERLDVRLFERTRRNVALTPAGRLFLDHAYKILSDVQRAMTEVRKANAGEAGRLAIGFIHSSTFGLTPEILRLFRTRFPDVELELSEMTMDQQLLALQERKIDLGISRPPISDPRLTSHLLATERFVLAVPETHPLTDQGAVHLKALAEESFVLFSQHRSQLFHSRIIAMCEKEGFVPNVVQQATQIHTVMGLVSANMGISIVPEVARNLNMPNAQFLEIIDNPPPVQVVMSWREMDRSPILAAFLDVARGWADGSA